MINQVDLLFALAAIGTGGPAHWPFNVPHDHSWIGVEGTVADLDGDGNYDRIHYTEDWVTVRAGLDECGFGDSNVLSHGLGLPFERFADVTGDGAADALAVDGDVVYVFEFDLLSFQYLAPVDLVLADLGLADVEDALVSAADADGDGLDELVVVGHKGATAWLGWLRWNGESFDVVDVVDVPGRYGDVVAWDNDNDGDDDLLLIAQGAPYLESRLLLNDGSQLQPVQAFTLDAALTHGVASELNGDDFDDLTLYGEDGGVATVQVYLNLLEQAVPAAGPQAFTVPAAFGPIVRGDWDHDGDPDLITGAGIFERLSPGVFVTTPLVLVPESDRFADAVDFDHDGNLDVLSSNLFVAGLGTFDPSEYWEPSPIESVFNGYLVDWDDDGDLDRVDNVDRILINDGSGVVFEEALFVLPPGAPGAGQSRPADYDGDGRLAFLRSIGAIPGRMRVEYAGGSQLVLEHASDESIPMNNDWEDSHARDFDLDGDLDFLALSTEFFSFASVWRNDGNGEFNQSFNIGVAQNGDVGDVDHDGDPDILAATGSNTLRLRRNLGDFDFSNELWSATSPDLVRFTDLDGDGVVEATWVNGIVVLNAEQGEPTSAVAGAFPGNHFQSSLLVDDLDLDGVADILVLDVEQGAYSRGLGGGSGFEASCPLSWEFWDEPGYSGPRWSLGDLDQDGDSDLVLRRVSLNRTNDGPEFGSRRQFGAKIAGTEEFVPVLGLSGILRPGEHVELRVRRGLGGATGFLATGFEETLLPDFPFDGLTTYVVPALPLVPFTLGGAAGVAGSGGTDFVLESVPAAFAGVQLFHQALLVDPEGPSGFTATNAIEANYGS